MAIDNKINFESFNARYLSFEQVANSFIPNDYFKKLMFNGHTILMGPRGCGKTTLLKMLTLPAMNIYDKIHKTDYRDRLPFRNVYIPTDIQWKKQLEIVESNISNSAKVIMINKAAITITVLISLCKSFEQSLHYELGLENISEIEVALCKQLIDAWSLPKPMPPTISSIIGKLLQLNANLNSQINDHILFNNNIDFDPIFKYDYLDLVRLGCHAFDSLSKIEKKKWALCFDELEVAPKWLQEELLILLRANDQDFVFKLTTAPIISFYQDVKEVEKDLGITSASEDNDYNVIRIWTSNQKELKDWARFCDQLVKKRIEARSAPSHKKDPEYIFGKNYLEYTIRDAFPNVKFDLGVDMYEENSPTWFAFKALAEKDESFAYFLKKKKINPLNPIPNNKKQLDEIFRKIKQLVIFRFHLKKNVKSLRSRKVVPIYFGLPTIYDISDGNPRILISMIDELLNTAIDKDGVCRALSINEQTRIIKNIAEKYLLILSTHPDSNLRLSGSTINIIDVIEKIGNFFFNKAFLEPFKMDQIGSFKVDEGIPQRYVKLIEFGLHQGAFVYMDNIKAIANEGIIDKRLRLSYTIMPYFNLILRDNSNVNLSTILDQRKTTQTDLFTQL